MANPNIVNVSAIYGETAAVSATTANANVVQNSSTGEVYKVNYLNISNITDTSSVDVTIDVIKDGSYFSLIRDISVPVGASLAVIAKDTSVYLQEGDALSCSASEANAHVVCSYERIG